MYWNANSRFAAAFVRATGAVPATTTFGHCALEPGVCGPGRPVSRWRLTIGLGGSVAAFGLGNNARVG